MGRLVLYGIDLSPPVRCVQLTLSALDLEYEFRSVNPFAGEHKTDDFLEKNPQHTVPVLEDDDQIIWDSHAISSYLVRKYADNDSLYPKDFYERAIVDQRLHFDSGVLFGCIRNITPGLFYRNETTIQQERIDDIYEAYYFMELFLQEDYIAGENLTIADFSLISTITTLEALAPVEPGDYPKIDAWMNRMAKLPYYEEANGMGAAAIKEMLKDKLERIV